MVTIYERCSPCLTCLHSTWDVVLGRLYMQKQEFWPHNSRNVPTESYDNKSRRWEKTTNWPFLTPSPPTVRSPVFPITDLLPNTSIYTAVFEYCYDALHFKKIKITAFSFQLNSYRRFYPQRSAGQAVITGVVPSPPRYSFSFSGSTHCQTRLDRERRGTNAEITPRRSPRGKQCRTISCL